MKKLLLILLIAIGFVSFIAIGCEERKTITKKYMIDEIRSFGKGYSLIVSNRLNKEIVKINTIDFNSCKIFADVVNAESMWVETTVIEVDNQVLSNSSIAVHIRSLADIK